MHVARYRNVLSMLIGLVALVSSASFAADGPSVTEAWVRAAPASVKAHAGYLILHNSTSVEASVIGATSPQYERAEIHLSRIIDGVATMTRQDQITVSPGGTLKMAPGGFHLMLMNPKAAIREGDTVGITFHMATGKTLSFTAMVKKAGGMSHDNHSGHKHDDQPIHKMN